MCLIAIAWKYRQDLPLVLIGNRDEFHARPTAPAGVDPDAKDVYGGRDLVQGGSWLQVSTRRRMAAVTNVRTGGATPSAACSRGWLVRDFVRADTSAQRFAADLAVTAGDYGPFNLLLWDGDALWCASNHPRFAATPVPPGFHAMSNGAFDAPWPKATAAVRTLRRWLDGADVARNAGAATGGALAAVLAGLRDARPAPDDALPDTGVGLALERRLSPAFIEDPRYGTRCSSVVAVDASGLDVIERAFDSGGQPTATTHRRLPTP